MNVGIITIFDLQNVGNRLQNYAVTSVLRKMGFECETLVPHRLPKTPYRIELDKTVSTLLTDNPTQAQLEYTPICKALRFENFTNAYIPWRQLKISQFGRETESQYDFFVTGSDQVWNPYFRNAIGQIENRLLSFAPPYKRVCFAPSIGVDEIPKQLHDLYEKEWFNYRYLSVREQTGADLIKQITGRDAEVVIDPTLMIDYDEWLSLAKPLPGFDYEKDYILFYFLGDPQEEICEEMKHLLTTLTNKNNLKIVHLFNPEEPLMSSVGPSEFLHLIKHAKVICTDSFHGTVFSILFKKPFLLADRTLIMRDEEINMSGRIHTLLNLLGLGSYLPQNHSWTLEQLWNLDYDEVYRRLSTEQNKAMQFLKKSLHMEVENEQE